MSSESFDHMGGSLEKRLAVGLGPYSLCVDTEMIVSWTTVLGPTFVTELCLLTTRPSGKHCIKIRCFPVVEDRESCSGRSTVLRGSSLTFSPRRMTLE